jgi:hypothetical protein
MGWRLIPLLASLYLPFIGGGLLTDDFAHVDHLSHIESGLRILDSPDTFGFYRPVTQASLALLPGTRGQRPSQARALNILLHASVIALAFLVARLVIQSDFGAGLAALSFALTPKAAPIAALWISARGDLLMSLFSLAAIAAWILWTRGGRWTWLAAAAIAYLLALSSKETATVLPLLLLITPRSERTWQSRAAGGALLVAIAAIVYTWRLHVGALTPFSGDAHYTLIAPLARWMRSTTNYSGRMLTAPIALLALLGLASLAKRESASGLKPALYGETRTIIFAAAFVVTFLAPVLPITLRSELYLYLPVFGVCLFTGWLAALLFQRVDHRLLTAAIVLYVLGFGGYQAARSLEIHRVLVFSEHLLAALRDDRQLAGREGQLLLVPSDAVTERRLKDAVGGYLHLALRHAHPDTRLTAAVQYTGEPPHQADVRLMCAYRQDQGTVTLSPAP